MKLGIIGSGNIVVDCLDAVKNIKGIELAGIYVREKSLDKGKELAEKYGISKIYTEYEKILNDKNIDTVYIGIVNNMHFEYTKKALEYGKNVVCEKPFTSTAEELKILIELAKSKKLFLFEAITMLYSPNFKYIKENLYLVGDVKLIQCNYSQYSSRYNKYLEKVVLPAFDKNMSGGALYDINIYNVHFVVGLFGRPKSVKYSANLGFNGIDTSGILVLSYDGFSAVCCGAKDSESPSHATVQGIKGYIKLTSPAGVAKSVEYKVDRDAETYNGDSNKNRMINEFVAFEKMLKEKSFEECYENLNHSLIVMEVLTNARKDAGIVFPADF